MFLLVSIVRYDRDFKGLSTGSPGTKTNIYIPCEHIAYSVFYVVTPDPARELFASTVCCVLNHDYIFVCLAFPVRLPWLYFETAVRLPRGLFYFLGST